MLAYPNRIPEGAAAIEAAAEALNPRAQFRSGWDTGLPVPVLHGVPECWPHVASVLVAAGFRPDPAEGREVVWAGPLSASVVAGCPPRPGVVVAHTASRMGTRFRAMRGGEEVGYCTVRGGLDGANALPGLRGWGMIADFQVDEPVRGQGIGTLLPSHATSWLRLGGGAQVAFIVGDDDEGRRASRLYGRWGCRAWDRQAASWPRATR